MEAMEALFVMFSVLWVYCRVQDWVLSCIDAPAGSRRVRLARIRSRIAAAKGYVHNV